MFNELTTFFENSIQSLFLANPLWALALAFLIIFFETGIVLTPFLPGDSLLFLLGAIFSSFDMYSFFLIFISLSLAAVLGDSLNYLIGSYSGKIILKRGRISKNALSKTEEFYKNYGSKTIIFARFVPIIRTIAPFTAGIGKMEYRTFLLYNIVGGIAWVGIFLFGGYFFGNIPLIKENLTIFLLIIIFASLIPGLIHLIKTKS